MLVLGSEGCSASTPAIAHRRGLTLTSIDAIGEKFAGNNDESSCS